MSVIHKIIKDMRPYMKENGFKLTKKCFFRIENDLAYCVELEMPSNLIYIYCYFVPLYVPAEYRYYTYGMRLKDVLSTLNIGVANIEQWCNELKEHLKRFVFPTFERIKSSDDFLNAIEHGLFVNSDHQVPRIDAYRLCLFTAFYKQDVTTVEKVCDNYKDILIATTYLTDEVKKDRLEEIEKIRRDIAKNSQANKKMIADIINKTKRSCFGLQKEDG